LKNISATWKKEKKMHDAKKRVYMRKNCIFDPILKWSTCENSMEGGIASEGVYCKMVNIVTRLIVTDKLFLQGKIENMGLAYLLFHIQND
jgi:hypothetical protein